MNQTIKQLDENKIYWININNCISIHLSNNYTGKRNNEGQLIDNIKNEGWYLFTGQIGKMIPVKKLRDIEALKMINKEVRK